MHIDQQSLTVAFAVLFGISEALAQIPQIQSNSLYQLVRNILKSLAGK